MKAVVYTKYGPPDVLSVQETPMPTPKNNEVLVQVMAATMNRTDCGFRSAKYFISRFVTGLFRPRQTVMGSEFAGKVVEVGASVKEFAPGDDVFGFDDVHGGAHAEYMTIRADGSVAKMPAGFAYEEAAPAGEGATYALNVIRATGISEGSKVLVYGASGAIGSAAVQLLNYMGAEVTAVCGTKNVELVKSLGAARVIDYQTEDFSEIGDRFDLILDAVGKSSYGVCKRLLASHGSYCSTELGFLGQNPLLAIWFSLARSRKVIFPIPKINKEIIDYVRQAMEAGGFKPVVDRVYPLVEIVAAATYVEAGQKTGSVIIDVAR